MSLSSAFSVSQEDIDAVLTRGSGFADSKYRIYRQFQKRQDKKGNIDFLKKEYGTGSGTFYYPDGSAGHWWHDEKGISIDKHGISLEHDLVLRWSQVERRLRELIKDDRYLNPKEKDHYADYLESVSAPQYEIDTQRKLKRQRFIEEKRELPPADKRDTLSLRLSDFIRDLNGYEKGMLSDVERTDLADVTSEQMEQHLSNPATVQQLLDFLSLVQGKTADVYSRSNAYRFSQELKELHPMCYLYHEGDVVYIGADKYEVTTLDDEGVYLQNVQFPILGQHYSRADFEEKLRENPANDHLKVVVTESQKAEILSEEKSDSIAFSIGFSEHPAFYDRELNDRFTDLSFALGNRLLGVLDEKQHREREGNKNIGWYHKTDFAIKAVINGEEFHYDGRFDIGDGEGDLIAHIKNFYDYSLSPNCPFIPEWKKQGEDYYREKMESLRWGRDVFIPFLMQHSELTPEDEKLLTKIMSLKNEWFARAEKIETPVSDREMDILRDVLSQMKMDDIGLVYEDGVIVARDGNNRWQGIEFYHFLIDEAMNFDENGELVGMVMDAETLADFKELAEYHGIPVADSHGISHYTVEQTSDAFAAPFIIRDNAVPEGQDGQYYDVGGIYQTFETEEKAQEYADALNKAEQEAEKEQPAELTAADLIGREITIDNRRYLIESVGEISGDVSLRDVTFQNHAGFPINRVEKIEYIRKALSQQIEGYLFPDGNVVFANREAEIVSQILGVTLLQHQMTEQESVPICRVPFESLDEKALKDNGYQVAVYDYDKDNGFVDVLPEKEKADSPTPSASRRNYRITDDALGVGGAKEKFRNNMAAIRLLHELQIENRLATPEEQETLSKYVGWGGLSMAFDERNAAWANEYKELKAALSEEEYRAAMESTLTAFYTPPVVIKAMYEALDRLGFSQGNILDEAVA